jgi:WD40 repeat protein
MLTTDRAVLIRYVRDGKPRRGSGLRISDQFVLTADHCAGGTGHTLFVVGGEYPATVHVRSGNADIDVAVLVAPLLPAVEPLMCVAMDRLVPREVQGCRALGFPVWKDGADGPRLAQVPGSVPTAEGVDPRAGPGVVPPMSLKITNPDIRGRRVPMGDLDQAGSPWAGMSGAVVVTADDCVIGVVRGHSPAEGVGSLTATRLEAIAGLPWDVAELFLAALQMPGPRRWPRVPSYGDARAGVAVRADQVVVGEIPQQPRRPPPPLPPLVPDTAFVGFVPALPSRFVARADIFDTVRDDVVSHATVGLVGMGGAGKTILATAVVHDPAVQAAFPDGITWVNAGQRVTPTLLQERLAARLTGETTVSFPAAEVGRHRLAELLAGRAFLLVIDDVWDAEALNALSVVGAPQGALLFTTRDRSIARAVGATVREVDELALEQALALLGRWTDTDFDRLPPVADALCMRVANLALGVALVGGMVKGRGAQPQDWQDVMGLLDTADIDAIADAYGPDSYKHASVLASITLSIDDLAPADRDRYRELAVFAGRGSVPLTAVSALWASAGCNASDTGRLLFRLTDRSLAQRDNRGWITLHDLQYDVAAHQLTACAGGLALAHSRLLDAYRSQCPQAGSVPSPSGREDPAAWAGGPDDGYLFQNLAFHLARAERFEQLDQLLVNFAWLERKLAVAGISDLLADYSHRQARPPDVDLVHDALQLSANILARHPRQLASQLVGRLLDQSEPSISALVDSARPSDGHPWLCPRTPGSLTEPGGPLERMLQDHTDDVVAVAVTADGKRIVSASEDRTVRVWNLASGRLERTVEGHTGWVMAVAVTPDGKRIVSASYDRTVRVWNLASGRLERTLEGHTGGVMAVAVTADGQRIVSGSIDYTVRVWNLASGRLERTLEGHTDPVMAVAVTADGQRIVSGSSGGSDRTVRVWDLASGRLERTLEGHTGILAVAVTADGQRIVSRSDDCIVRVWDLASGRLERTLGGHNDPVMAVAVTADGQRIVCGSANDTVQVWDLASGRLERTLAGHIGGVSAVAVTADGQRIVSGSRDHTVRVWNLARGQSASGGREGHTGEALAVAVTADGKRIVSGGDDHTVRVWNLASGRLRRTLKGHTGGVLAVAVTADGQHIISASRDQTVRVWNLTAGGLERTLAGHTGGVLAVAVTADGKRIVSGGDDHTVRVWNLASGRLEATLEGHTRGVLAVAVTADGQRIVSGGDENTVRVWDLASGCLERTLAGHTGGVLAVAVTADGQRIVSASRDQTVRVWNLTAGGLERTLKGHTGRVLAVAVTADGQRIVSGGDDHTVRVWDPASSTLMAHWVGDATIASCAGHPGDSTTLVCSDSDGRVVVLSLREPRSARDTSTR